MRKGFKTMFIILIAIVLVALILILVILPPSKGKVKPFLDADKKVINGSIAEKVFVQINGDTQGMIIRGENLNNPVLFFLSGGPGIPEYWLSHEFPTDLEKHFTVCYWSYRGNGLSYHKNSDKKLMTTEQFLSDAVEVTNYLRNRFSQDKVYLLSHSFGSYIGLNLVSEHPELFKAYFTMSQISNQKKSEQIAYKYMKEQYEEASNTKMVAEFSKYPILTSDDAYAEYLSSPIRDNAMHELGVGTTRKMRNVIKEIFFPTLRMKDFTISERLNIWIGKAFSKDSDVVNESFNFDAFQNVKSVEIPIYFFAGKYDYTCAYELQKEYFDFIEAPQKNFYTFEESAHSPLFEEPDKFVDILVSLTQ